MPYKEHELFKQPKEEEDKVWRYMNLTKFISLLQNKELYLSRADKFEDPFEGSFTMKNHKGRMSNHLCRVLKECSLSMRTHVPYDDKFDNWQKYVAINCWHLNNFESAAMWSLYVNGNEGVAIQSSYSGLKKSLENNDTEIFIGQVNYIDYDKDIIKEGPLNRFVHKLNSYRHEQEVRVVVAKLPDPALLQDVILKKENAFNETIENGLPLDIDINALIQKVYIHPKAPKWFSIMVVDLIKKYGFDFEVESSKLSVRPLF